VGGCIGEAGNTGKRNFSFSIFNSEAEHVSLLFVTLKNLSKEIRDIRLFVLYLQKPKNI
jgi:hypothetical protein